MILASPQTVAHSLKLRFMVAGIADILLYRSLLVSRCQLARLGHTSP